MTIRLVMLTSKFKLQSPKLKASDVLTTASHPC